MLEPLGPPPRAVRYRSGKAWQIWSVRLFSLPHVLVGVALFVASIALCAWAAAGTDRTASVVTTRMIPPSSNGRSRRSWQVVYRHEVDGKELARADFITLEEFHRLNAKDLTPAERTVTVRGIGSPPLFWERLVDPTQSLWHDPIIASAMALFWCGFLLIGLRNQYAGPARMRRLCATGVAATGTITGREMRAGRRRSTFHYLKFSFDFEGVKQSGEQQVTAADFRTVADGDSVTVLHPDGAATPAIIYELCPYACESQSGFADNNS